MVRYEQRGAVALLTIDRPEARNAVNGDVANGMEAAIDQLQAAADVWGGALTGQGPGFPPRGASEAHRGGQGRRVEAGAGWFRRDRDRGADKADHRRRRRP